MRNKRAESKRNIIARLCWFVAILLSLQAYWWVMTNFVIRDFWDPQFALKQDFLRERVKENPNHPLWLMIGSSRVESDMRFLPVLDRMREKSAPLFFNFGLGGADLFREYICLRRLLEDGPKPQRVGIEIIGPYLNYKESGFYSLPTLIVRARRDEIDEYCSFSADPVLTRSVWQRSRIDPAYKYGMKLPHQALSLRLVPIPPLWRLEKHFYDKWGWAKVPPAPISKEEYKRGFDLVRGYFVNDPAGFKVSANNNRILRKILDLCKKSGVDVFLIQLPESSDFQALYSSQETDCIATYLQQIKGDYGVPVINAQSWMPDPENFTDGSHLNATGVEKFTPRFMDEALKLSK